MQTFKVTVFRYGVYCTIIIKTIPELITRRAFELGMTEILHIEEV
jgi:hypothetical protein